MANTAMKAFGTANRLGHDSRKFYSRRIFDGHETHKPESKDRNEDTVPVGNINQIYNHSSENMDELPNNSVHMMVTSPPYNVGKEYDDDLTLHEYLEMLHGVWKETYRVLVPGGRACVNVANVGRKPYLPLNAMITQSMLNIGYLMRGEIIWNKSASAGTSCAWGSWLSPSNPSLRDIHEYIMVFSKFDYDRKVKGGNVSIKRDEFLAWTKSIWAMPAESARKVKHPAPFPVDLPNRLIHLYTYQNDIILDPFMGSGTTAIASIKSGRRYVGYDTSGEYVAIANQRIEHA